MSEKANPHLFRTRKLSARILHLVKLASERKKEIEAQEALGGKINPDLQVVPTSPCSEEILKAND